MGLKYDQFDLRQAEQKKATTRKEQIIIASGEYGQCDPKQGTKSKEAVYSSIVADSR